MRIIVASMLVIVFFSGCARPPDLTDQVCAPGEFTFGIDDDGDLRCGEVDWASVEDIPAGFADGTDDVGAAADGNTLGDLSCTSGQIAQFDGASWNCATLSRHEVTLLTYGSGVQETSLNSNWRIMTDVGSFTKRTDGSIVKLHWTGHANVVDAGIGKCSLQLRIDDKNRNNIAPATSVQGSSAIIGNSDGAVPFHTTDVFTWPNAGIHDVSIYAKGAVDECFLNPGNFQHSVIIEEIG